MAAILMNVICRKEQKQKRACKKRAVVMPLWKHCRIRLESDLLSYCSEY